MARRQGDDDGDETASGKRQDTLCAWNDHGYKCYQPGVISDATDGAGAWYCREHETKRLGRRVPRAIARAPIEGYGISARQEGETSEQYQQRAMVFLRAHINKIGRATPGKGWAHSILDRFADGDPTVSDMAFRMACEAIGADPETVRRERDAAGHGAVNQVEF